MSASQCTFTSSSSGCVIKFQWSLPPVTWLHLSTSNTSFKYYILLFTDQAAKKHSWAWTIPLWTHGDAKRRDHRSCDHSRITSRPPPNSPRTPRGRILLCRDTSWLGTTNPKAADEGKGERGWNARVTPPPPQEPVLVSGFANTLARRSMGACGR